MPSVRQIVGMVIAFSGLALIGSTVGSDLTLLAFSLALASALSWAVGNVLLKRVGPQPMLALIAWLSLIPPLPALLVSVVHDGEWSLLTALAGASWTSIAAAIYLGAIATILAYAIWGTLLVRYSTATVAPFALLAPCVGVISSALVFGESFGAIRYAGMALILCGLAAIVLPLGRNKSSA